MSTAHITVSPIQPTSHDQVCDGEWLVRPDGANIPADDTKRYIHFFPDQENFSLCGRRFAPESYLLYTTGDRLIHTIAPDGTVDSRPALDHQVCCPKCYVMHKVVTNPRYAYTPGDVLKARNNRRRLGDRIVAEPDSTFDIDAFRELLDNPVKVNDDGAELNRYVPGLVVRQKINKGTLYLFTDAPNHLTRVSTLKTITAGEMNRATEHNLTHVTFIPFPRDE